MNADEVRAADGLIARGMTVAASRMYAQIVGRFELARLDAARFGREVRRHGEAHPETNETD